MPQYAVQQRAPLPFLYLPEPQLLGVLHGPLKQLARKHVMALFPMLRGSLFFCDSGEHMVGYGRCADVVYEPCGCEQPPVFRHQRGDKTTEGELVEQRSGELRYFSAVARTMTEIEGSCQLLKCIDLHAGHSEQHLPYHAAPRI